jgi:hypothetical protein
VLGVGLALVALYALVAALTGLLGAHRVRPLFDTIGPAPPYQWVNPPPQFAAGNVKPKPMTYDIPLAQTKTTPLGVSSSEAQLVLNLPAGAIPAHGADTTVHIVITPLDPATLAPLPPQLGLRPDGNAYRAELTYKPSGQPVDNITSPGNVFVVVPLPGHGIAFSPDGTSWQLLDSQPVGGQSAMGAVFRQPGYYMGAAKPSAATQTTKKGGSSTTVIAVVGVAVLALALVALPAGVRLLRGSRGGRAGPR